jgi:hypothetical protein
MKTKLIISFFACQFFLLGLAAQPCSNQELLNQAGYWIKGKPGSTQGVSSSDLVKEKALIKKILDPFIANFSPKGVDVWYVEVYSGHTWLPAHVNPGNWYYTYFNFYNHIGCPYDKEKEKINYMDGNDMELTISVNDFNFGFNKTFFVPLNEGDEDPGTTRYTIIPYKPKKAEHGWYWEYEVKYRNRTEKRWIISNNNKQPFSHLTKREYAENYQKYFEQKMEQVEINKTNMIKAADKLYEEIKRVDEKAASKARIDHIAYADKIRQTDTEFYRKPHLEVKKYLETTDQQTLEEPAVIDMNKKFEDFAFAADQSPSAGWPIKPNPEFFNTKLPKASPQFFTVTLTYINDNAIVESTLNKFFPLIDFNRLKSMLTQ